MANFKKFHFEDGGYFIAFFTLGTYKQKDLILFEATKSYLKVV